MQKLSVGVVARNHIKLLVFSGTTRWQGPGMANPLEKDNRNIACSRRSDSGARASPRFFPALSLALFFARAPLSERLEQANRNTEDVKKR